jgi:cytochrome P450
MAAEFVSTIPTTRSCPYAPAPEHPRLREHPEPLVRVKRPDCACVWAVTRQQLAFDFGRHQRLGQDLARLEPPIAIDTLFRRIPGPRW